MHSPSAFLHLPQLFVKMSQSELALAATTLSIPGIAVAAVGAIFLWNLLNRRSAV